jgi:hypothetical protein
MPISFMNKVKVPEDVLISGLQEESVILNLNSERYFGLNEVGTRIFSALTTSASIEAAFELLVEEYDVDPKLLRQDLLSLVDKLLEQGLVEVVSS